MDRVMNKVFGITGAILFLIGGLSADEYISVLGPASGFLALIACGNVGFRLLSN